MTRMVTHMTSSHSSPSDMCIQPENSQSRPSPLLSPSYCDHTPKQQKFQLTKAKWIATEEAVPMPACKVHTPHHTLCLPPHPPPPPPCPFLGPPLCLHPHPHPCSLLAPPHPHPRPCPALIPLCTHAGLPPSPCPFSKHSCKLPCPHPCPTCEHM